MSNYLIFIPIPITFVAFCLAVYCFFKSDDDYPYYESETDTYLQIAIWSGLLYFILKQILT